MPLTKLKTPSSDSSRLDNADISVVIPIFNPGDYFVDHIISIVALLEPLSQKIELILVNDGSSEPIFDKIPDSILGKLNLTEHKKNLGKGAALKTGFRLASGNWIGFIDADGDIPARFLIQIIDAVSLNVPNNSADIVLASKTHSESKVHSSLLRKISSSGFNYLVKLLFSLPISDTQTGLKLFSRKVIDSVLEQSVENGFLIDLEILNLATIRGLSKFKEVPVTIVKRHNSTLSMSTVTTMLVGIFKLKLRLRKLTKTTVTKLNQVD